MQNFRTSTVLAASILLAPAGAIAQTTNVAYASTPRTAYVVFFDSMSGQLTPAASKTVRMAARAAASAHTIRVAGRADRAEAVKAQLVRDGVPADAIVVSRQTGSPLLKATDGVNDPLNRRVEISF